MRVLHILNELRHSGAEVMLKLAAPHWLEAGVESAIWSRGKRLGEYSSVLAETGYEIIHYPIAKRGDLFSHLFRSEMGPRLRSFDCVHIHTDSMAASIAVALRRNGASNLLRTVHNNFNFSGWSLSRVRRLGDRFLARRCGVRHVAISESVRANELRIFRNPSTLVRNWIDVEHYRPPTAEERVAARAALGVAPDTRLWVTVGNGSRQKNYHVIIEALAKMHRPNVSYVQVGNPHRENFDQGVAKALGVAGQVRFPGPCADPRPWLWAADLFLMPSLFEGFGLAAGEALATGVPCVFSRVIGLDDWAANDLPLFWSGTDVASLVGALEKAEEYAVTDRDRPGTRRIRAELSPERGAREYLQLYSSTLNKPTGASAEKTII